MMELTCRTPIVEVQQEGGTLSRARARALKGCSTVCHQEYALATCQSYTSRSLDGHSLLEPRQNHLSPDVLDLYLIQY